jgi:hypothetical protein
VIGTRPDGVADGVMLRGNAYEAPEYSIQYSAYVSARSSINQLQASRLAGGDTSISSNLHIAIGFRISMIPR